MSAPLFEQVIRHKYYAKPVIQRVPSPTCSSPICSLAPLNEHLNRDAQGRVQTDSKVCHDDSQLVNGASQHSGCNGNGSYSNGLSNRYVEDANHNTEAVAYDGAEDNIAR